MFERLYQQPIQENQTGGIQPHGNPLSQGGRHDQARHPTINPHGRPAQEPNQLKQATPAPVQGTRYKNPLFANTVQKLRTGSDQLNQGVPTPQGGNGSSITEYAQRLKNLRGNNPYGSKPSNPSLGAPPGGGNGYANQARGNFRRMQ